MDKLSEHAIRMLEIVDNERGFYKDMDGEVADIARAVYVTILQVQMLKEVNRKKSDSEKPNNCETCKHEWKSWDSEACDPCTKAHSNYEPKTEPQNHSGEATEMVEDEPQTDDGTAFIKRHGLRVDYGDEVPCDLKPFIDW